MQAGRWRDQRRRLLSGVLVVYLAVVAWGVFGPSPTEQIRQAGEGAQKVADGIGSAVPRGQAGTTEQPQSGGDGEQVFGTITAEEAANVAMFVPLGILFPLCVPRWQWWTVIAGTAMSAMIEGIQLVFLSWRSPSLEDIGWNSLGTLVGFTVWLVAASLRRRRLTPV